MAAYCRLAPAAAIAPHGPLTPSAQKVQCMRHTSSGPSLAPCRSTGSSIVPQGPRLMAQQRGRRVQRHSRATSGSVGASEESDETASEDTTTEPAQSSASTPTPSPSTSASTWVSPPAAAPPAPSSSSSSTWSSSGSSGAGDPASREVLDAFFLGRALAEVVLERVGSAVGEFLSDVGRAQAEQQQQIRQFQEEVQARAEEARQKAAKQTKGPSS